MSPFQQAVACNAGGQLDQAEALCRVQLDLQPDHHEARHLLAVVLCRQGRYTEGAALLEALLADDPANPRLLLPLGDARHEAGDPAAAAVLFARLAALCPTDPAVHTRLGISLLAAGRGTAAIEAFRRTLALDPGLTQGWFNLGTALQAEGDLTAAIEAFDRAITLAPDHAEAWLNLGGARLELERESEALAAFDRALALRPDWLEAATNRGVALERLGRLEEAVAWQENLARRHPGRPEPLANLGTALHRLGRIEPALAATSAAAALAPDDPAIAANLALVQNWAGDDDAAAAGFLRALARAPNHPTIHYNYAQLLLRRGDFSAGWAEYEWRWRGAVPALSARHFAVPRWQGEPLAGRTLLVHAEQGLGDSLQFVRFIEPLRQQGAALVLEAQPQLRDLLRDSLPGLTIVTRAEPAPRHHLHVPLLSLPGLFGTTETTLPGRVPYLTVPTAARQRWRQRLSAPAGIRKIGLAWAGNPRHKTDHLRSLPLAALLAALPREAGLTYHALQFAPTPEDAGLLARHADLIHDLSGEIGPLVDLAAAMEALDLVVTIDTFTIHLAGALGRPTFGLLQAVPDWRWQRDRSDSPWYPSLRLFRQPAPGDWDSVLKQLASALRDGATTH